MQDVLEHGVGGIQYAVVDKLMTEVASLSCHQYGHYVLQSCILKIGDYRGELLRRLIQELERLGDRQLAGLVKNGFGSHVLSRLLDTAGTHVSSTQRRPFSYMHGCSLAGCLIMTTFFFFFFEKY